MRLETDRLILRSWEARDIDALAALNADPDVMRFFAAPLTREETIALVARITALAGDELGFLAVEEKASGQIAGMVGMAPLKPDMPFAPGHEIGWRLARPFWGKGYASEAARAWLTHGFDTLALPEIVAFTYTGNMPSRRVMERLGMHRDPADDFAHPALPKDHLLSGHVLYRLKAEEFRP